MVGSHHCLHRESKEPSLGFPVRKPIGTWPAVTGGVSTMAAASFSRRFPTARIEAAAPAGSGLLGSARAALRPGRSEPLILWIGRFRFSIDQGVGQISQTINKNGGFGCRQAVGLLHNLHLHVQQRVPLLQDLSIPRWMFKPVDGLIQRLVICKAEESCCF